MKKLLLLVASLFVMWANSAGATIIVVNPPARVEEGNNPGVWDWTYAAVLQPGISMKPGDFFTIYDFPLANFLSHPSFGTTSGTDNASFEVTVQATGLTPPLTAPTDTAISNVTVKLLDGDTTTAGDQDISAIAGGLQLGTLIVRSNTNQVAQSLFGSALDSGTNTPQSQIGVMEVAAIPEPASITLLMAGLAACGVLSFRRRNSGS
jgi:hypothetical protein